MYVCMSVCISKLSPIFKCPWFLWIPQYNPSTALLWRFQGEIQRPSYCPRIRHFLQVLLGWIQKSVGIDQENVQETEAFLTLK